MREVSIDISGSQTKGVFDYPKAGTMFAYVITVCDGNVYQGDGYSPGQSASVQLTAGGTGVLLAGSVPQMASADGNVYISDGYNYVQLDLATATCSTICGRCGWRRAFPRCPRAKNPGAGTAASATATPRWRAAWPTPPGC